jgi:hypothetical protein
MRVVYCETLAKNHAIVDRDHGGKTYLLRRQMRVRIHSIKHLRLRLAICSCGVLLHSTGIHSRLGAIFLLLGHTMLTQRAVIRRAEVSLNTVLRLRKLARSARGSRCARSTSLAGPLSVRSSFLAGDNVDKEIKHIGLGKGGSDVGALEGAALVVLGVDPSAHG